MLIFHFKRAEYALLFFGYWTKTVSLFVHAHFNLSEEGTSEFSVEGKIFG
jgi:hypothetical protein